MGEVALRKLQAGAETTRGTVVAATKKINGQLTPTYKQDRRYAMEDRGNFTDKFRANPKLIDAAFSIANLDMTFEDTPWVLDMILRGGVTPTGSAAAGYTWTYAPDVNTDTLGTRTFEWGDDTVIYQGPFAVGDTLDLTCALDNALMGTLAGFVQTWTPNGSGGFTGFTGGLADRLTESAMGWQHRLFIDPDASAPGTSPIVGRYKSSTYQIHNQNKRKYFGDGQALFTRLGRGRRQVSCQYVFEALDETAWNYYYSGATRYVIRSVFAGTTIPGATALGTTTAALTGSISSIPITATSAALIVGQAIIVGGQTFLVSTATAAGATAVPVYTQTVIGTIASGASSTLAKTIIIDTWGVFDTVALGAVDTNTIFTMTMQGVYSAVGAKELQVTVINGQATL